MSVENSSTLEIKTNVEVAKYFCDMCDKMFDKKGPLANHRIHVHTVRTKEMVCDFCDKIFQSKMDLCSHMSSNHSEHFVKKETNDATK